jgi:hypothetical protein
MILGSGMAVANVRQELGYAANAGSPKKSNGRVSRSSRAFMPLDSRKIANVVIAKNLNLASSQVQVQALEVPMNQPRL